MPSLFRFLFVIGLIGAIIYGSLYALAVFLEPTQTEVTKPVLGVGIKR